jgi:N-hydroxyarylamine O-acetyltransferase
LHAVQDKLIARGRGGYCFEHNMLMWAVLAQLGFPVAGLAGRVRWNSPDNGVRPLGHMALRVEADQQPYLVDVGFGGLTLTAPLRLDVGEPQITTLEPFLIHGGTQRARTLNVLLEGSWRPLYEFEPTEYQPMDYEAWNWWTCTAPESPFVAHLMAARPVANGRHALADNRYTFRPLGGVAHTQVLGTVAEIRGILSNEFGIAVPESAALDAKLATLI